MVVVCRSLLMVVVIICTPFWLWFLFVVAVVQ